MTAASPEVSPESRRMVGHLVSKSRGLGETHGDDEIILDEEDAAIAALESHIATIERERDELRETRLIWETSIKGCWAALSDAQSDVTRLRSALENWGRHHAWCVTLGFSGCNCGYSDAMKIGTEEDDAARVSGRPE